MVRRVFKPLLPVVICLALYSCRGQKFEQQPVHPILNMDQQNRFEAQESNPFFADNRSMRQPVEGTIARGNLRHDPVYYQGINPDSSFVEHNPVDLTKSFLYQGKDRYEIFCTPCHGYVGDGQGIIMTGGYGFVPAPSYHIDRIRNMPDGELYSAIANGVRTMPSYAHQVPVRDRWAIVAYIRALQKSQHVPEQDMQKYNVSLAELNAENIERTSGQEQKPASAGAVSVEQGKELFQTYACGSCHTIDGAAGLAPTFKGFYGSERELADGSTVTADAGYIIESIQYPAAKVANGFMPVMPSFRDMMSDQEMESIVEYLKTLK